ncbi:MAG: Gfo/Idh/MocA family oxidoreductase [Spirochaetes bacterium]|nr:Gfo/Idh/MocA family oxidoreductase [Spirochaetota bacterium]
MKKSTPITAAIIGCGVIGPNHARALELDGRAALKWACDIDAKRQGRIAAPKFTRDYREVLADPEVDLVCVCTPHPVHAEVACAALAAGKHVVCEKPLASHPSELAKMIEAAGKRPDLVAAGIFQHRFTPFARRLKTLLSGGDFGRILQASVEFRCTRTEEYYASDAWRGKWKEEGGGVLLNQAIHTLDIFQWWLGGDPVEVDGTVARRRMACIEVEDFGEARVRFASGSSAVVRAVNDGVSGWGVDLVIEAEYGSVRVGDSHRPVEVKHQSTSLATELWAMGQVRLDGIRMPGKAVYGDHHALQLADAVSAILEGRKPFVTFQDASAANAIVLGMYHSTAVGGAVSLPLKDYKTPVLPLAP